MTTLSCIVVTTLIVVSLANLVLLVHVIMHSMVKCDETRTILKKSPKIIKRENSFKPRTSYKFMAALLVVLEDEEYEFVCGVAVITKKWVLTAAHCVEPMMEEPRDKVKVQISSSTQKLKGIWYDVDKILIHDKYRSSGFTSNVALISVQQVFKEKDIAFALIPTRNYKYLANTTAAAVAWKEMELSSLDVKLISHKSCNSAFPDRITDGVFCTERKSCFSDYGGFLIQKDLVIGVLASGVGCGGRPIVYTKTSMFEDWLKYEKIAVHFKDVV